MSKAGARAEPRAIAAQSSYTIATAAVPSRVSACPGTSMPASASTEQDFRLFGVSAHYDSLPRLIRKR